MKLLNQRYRLMHLLGEGSMGQVYLAEDMKLCGKLWAIKLVRESESVEQLAEAKLLSRLDHPRIPRIVDLFFSDDGETACIVMDYVPGQTLREAFEQADKLMDVRTVLDVAVQLCELYVYLHEEVDPAIIHRDLKPDNIMLDVNGQVKLIDFGISRQHHTVRTGDTLPFASLGFASPEQLQGFQTDVRSDLYSLGALVYYLLSAGKYARSQQMDLHSELKHVPSSLVHLLAILLQTKPHMRVSTASELQHKLMAIVKEIGSDQDKAMVSNHKNGTKVIACRGVNIGVGCTHAALMIANSLATTGRKVAFVEYCNRQSLRRLWNEERTLITRAGVDYFPDVHGLAMADWLYAGYDYLLLDFGSELDEAQECEFARADWPLLVAFGGPLRSFEWHDFCTHQRNQPFLLQGRTKLLLMFSCPEHNASLPIHYVPLCLQPLEPEPSTVSFVMHMLAIDDSHSSQTPLRFVKWMSLWKASLLKWRKEVVQKSVYADLTNKEGN